jgi:Txe/YoeB family toxin of Txe-Axe toxin-antitoxin module
MNFAYTDRFKKEKAFAREKAPILHAQIEAAIAMIESWKFTPGSNFKKLNPRHQNLYSMRLNGSDRLVFKKADGIVYLLRCRGHYDDN